jgi:antitoxin ParD1/3/4
MPTRNINLTDHFDQFVQDQITVGRYKNASEVLRAGLRLLEQQTMEDDEKLAALRALATEGFQSLDRDEGITLAGDQRLADFIGKVGRRASRRARHDSGVE